MHALDSRNIGSVNCYIQKIIGSGDLILEVGKTSSGFLPMEDGKGVKSKVTALPENRKGEREGGKQHVVPLTFSKNEFHININELKIEEGDAIIFHGGERKLPGFAIRGMIGKHSFCSTELVDQAVFTHAFGLPGRYEWRDANGSGVGGVITVVNEPSEGKDGAKRAMERLGEGVVVHIVGKKVAPQEVTISTGQTVFFAVEQTQGITITDVTLLDYDKDKVK